MMTEKRCQRCGNTKPIDEFPLRGKEKDRLGNPLYRGKCKTCESEEKLQKYYLRKELQNKEEPEHRVEPLKMIEVLQQPPKLLPSVKRKIEGDDYEPWSKRLGRPLTENEKVELDTSVRQLIITMIDLAYKKRSN